MKSDASTETAASLEPRGSSSSGLPVGEEAARCVRCGWVLEDVQIQTDRTVCLVCDIADADNPVGYMTLCDACGEVTSTDATQCQFCSSPLESTTSIQYHDYSMYSTNYMLCCDTLAGDCRCPQDAKKPFFALNDDAMNTYDGDIYDPNDECEQCLLAYTADCVPYLDWLRSYDDDEDMSGKLLTRCLYFDDGRGSH